MNPAETAELLATVQAYDRRTIGKIDVGAWHAALHDLDLDACRQAVVAHYAEQTAWLQPAHVRQLVRAAGNDRSMRALPKVTGKPKPEWFDELVQVHREQARSDWFRPDGRRIADGRLAGTTTTTEESA